MVGAEGFEPPTLCSQSRCATRLRYAPISNIDCNPILLPDSSSSTDSAPPSGRPHLGHLAADLLSAPTLIQFASDATIDRVHGGYSSAAERLTVAQDVVGSIPTSRPNLNPNLNPNLKSIAYRITSSLQSAGILPNYQAEPTWRCSSKRDKSTWPLDPEGCLLPAIEFFPNLFSRAAESIENGDFRRRPTNPSCRGLYQGAAGEPSQCMDRAPKRRLNWEGFYRLRKNSIDSDVLKGRIHSCRNGAKK